MSQALCHKIKEPCKLENTKITSKDYVVYSLAVIAGILIWVLSPTITGQQEPWDSESSYYFVSLFIAGAFCGALHPIKIWRWAVAIYFGQLLAAMIVAMGPLILLGVFFLAGYTLVALAGAASAAALVTMYKERHI